MTRQLTPSFMFSVSAAVVAVLALSVGGVSTATEQSEPSVQSSPCAPHRSCFAPPPGLAKFHLPGRREGHRWARSGLRSTAETPSSRHPLASVLATSAQTTQLA